MDPLSDMIALLRPSTAISKPITGRGRWAVRYTAHDAPGFTIILKGGCWLAFDDAAQLELQRGDFVLLPSTPAFTLSSGPGMAGELRDPIETAARHGEQDGDADFVSLGGTFRIEPANAALLRSLLPRMIYIPASEGRAPRVTRVIQQIMEECESEEPGKEMILQRLLEVLLIEALRWRGVVDDGVQADCSCPTPPQGTNRPLRARAGRQGESGNRPGASSYLSLALRDAGSPPEAYITIRSTGTPTGIN
jgi:hypothetical protein